tara:strand:+ start:2235 stop:2411 length:177 start_codon:yes stop_codon:yes gene_type:complete
MMMATKRDREEYLAHRLRALRNRLRLIEGTIEALQDEIATVDAQLDELQYPKKGEHDG